MKVFINKEADYESVLERVREDLFGSVDRQGTTPDFTVKQHHYILLSHSKVLSIIYPIQVGYLYRKMGRLSFRRGMAVQRHIDGHLPNGWKCQEYVINLGLSSSVSRNLKVQIR